MDRSRTGSLYWTDRTRVRNRNRIRNRVRKTERYGCTNEEEQVCKESHVSGMRRLVKESREAERVDLW